MRLYQTIKKNTACPQFPTPHIILGSESKLDSSISNGEVFPCDYEIFRKDRISDNPGGGIFIAIHNTILATIFAVGVEGKSDFEVVLEKFDLRKALTIGAWVTRFLRNSRNSTNKAKGPLSTAEVKRHETFLVKRAQQQGFNNVSFEQDQEQLNLQPNEEGVLECRGRIQGEYPVYLPDTALLATKIVQRAHVTTLHGGVGLTMASVRERYWIPPPPLRN